MIGRIEDTVGTLDEGQACRPSVIDSHVHFWDRRRSGLVYDWLVYDAPAVIAG